MVKAIRILTDDNIYDIKKDIRNGKTEFSKDYMEVAINTIELLNKRINKLCQQ